MLGASSGSTAARRSATEYVYPLVGCATWARVTPSASTRKKRSGHAAKVRSKASAIPSTYTAKGHESSCTKSSAAARRCARVGNGVVAVEKERWSGRKGREAGQAEVGR